MQLSLHGPKVFYLRNDGSIEYSIDAIPAPVNSVSLMGALRATLKTDRGAAQPIIESKITDNNTNEIRPIFSLPYCWYFERTQSILYNVLNIMSIIGGAVVFQSEYRFSSNFMFQLTEEEWENLRFQNGISSLKEWGGRRSPPFAFTEQGVAMLSSILRSRRAVQVNIAIMRTFVEMRKMLFSYADLCRRIDALESRYDDQFRIIFDALRQLMAPPSSPENEQRIGFRLD